MPSCHSTNDIALQILKKPDTHEGLVVITDHQTAGRGQRGNDWKSGLGTNLTLSIVLKPSFLQASDQFYFNMVASLAVLRMLNKCAEGEDIKVKWPNDVLLKEKKVAGILIENTLQRSAIQWSVMGIGVNVNQQDLGIGKATSLFTVTNVVYELPVLFELLIESLEYYYLKLKFGKRDELKSEYLQHLFGFHEFRKYRGEHLFDGKIIDVAESGRLVMETNRGIQSFDFKEVEFLY
ncbi:biotin--[acetyl-CoA-carboxylase] ligase [Roseivirga echinicomitans]